MIEAREFRIGNFALVDQVPTKLDITHLMVLSGYSHPHCKIDPIPLTEEWLVRFGFYEYDRMGNNIFFSFKEKESFNFNLCLYFYELRISFFGLSWDSSIKIYQVHQLQSLYFALTGEELKLNDK